MPAYPSLAGDNLVDTLRLIRSENIGPVTFFHLLARFGSAKAALAAIPELAVKGGRKKAITIASIESAEAEIAAAEAYGAVFVPYGSPDYPSLLHEIYDPPPLLAVKGNASILTRKMLAIVGSRNASTNGFHFARKLAEDLGKAGYAIASGLARGIDTGVHTGALKTGTVAVIAGGINNIYPPQNEGLYHDIIAGGGAIISEQPFGMEPLSRTFPARNRIISGMSKATAVVEASFKSGSLITANYALEQGRDVFAVPGSPLDPRCKGSNNLIRTGAIITESAEDVLTALGTRRIEPIAESDTPAFTTPTTVAPVVAIDDDMRAKVLRALGFEPTPLDDLIAHTGLSAAIVLGIILEMELAGAARRAAGGKVSRVAE